VATDPFVAPELGDLPRQAANLAPGVRIPPAHSWHASRPGDLEAGQPVGGLLGRPGPNVGYALALTNRMRDSLSLAPHESIDDAVAAVSELAMRRAASFGRAPVMADVEAAATVLGYTGDAPAGFATWRADAVHGADHEWAVRRAVVDAVPESALRKPPPAGAQLDDVRSDLKAALDH
jgi:hypothetical protein